MGLHSNLADAPPPRPARRAGTSARRAWRALAWLCVLPACTSAGAGYGGGPLDVGGSGPFDAVFGACRGATCVDGGASDGVAGSGDGSARGPDSADAQPSDIESDAAADATVGDTATNDAGSTDAGVNDTAASDAAIDDTAASDTAPNDTALGDTAAGDTAAGDMGATDASDGGSTSNIAPGALLISELHPDPAAVSDAAGEWIEVANTTTQAIDLRGLALTDKNNKPHVITAAAPVWVPGGGFAVLALQGEVSKNGGVNATYVYAGISLANGGSVITLKSGAVIIDSVTYGDGSDGWPKVTAGTSLSLTPSALAASNGGHGNDSGGVWCLGTTTFGAGDKGTPGVANPPCPAAAVCGNNAVEAGETCDDGNTTSGDGCSKSCQTEVTTAPSGVIVNEILFDPAVVGDSAGEWVELYNPTGQGVNLQGWKVADKTSSHTIAAAGGSLVVPAGGFMVLGANADPTLNGGAPVAYAWKSLAMSNATSGGRVALYNTSGALVDEVLYQTSQGKNGWPGKVSGASYQLAPGVTDAKANDAGGAWCVATQAFGKGDKGSPGKPNDASCKAP